jgi:hypothetical protein
MTAKLTQHIGTTCDTRGCEFRYRVTSAPAGTRWTRTGRLVQVRERRYTALGLSAPTLQELRRLVGELP